MYVGLGAIIIECVYLCRNVFDLCMPDISCTANYKRICSGACQLCTDISHLLPLLFFFTVIVPV